MFVVYSDYINRLLPSERRATLLSFSNMVFSFFMIFLFPAFGLIGEHFDLETAFTVTAMIATVLAVINLVILKRHSKREQETK
jgi:MFS family permease